MRKVADRWQVDAARWCGLVVLGVVLGRVLYFLPATDSVLVSVIPDDAFYYMKMAQHRAEAGRWTFDGVTPATGFHLLYGYFLVFIFRLSGSLDWRALFLLVGVVASAAVALTAYCVGRVAQHRLGAGAVPLAVLPFLTASAVQQGTVMMESWLVMMAAGLTLLVISNERARDPRHLGLCVVLGVLGSLSRSDFGMFPAALAAGHLLMFRPLGLSAGLKKSLAVTAGAAVGVLLVEVHGYFISGHLQQASAQTKFFWSSVMGHKINPAIMLLESIALPSVTSRLGRWLMRLLLIAAVAPAIFRLPRAPRERSFPETAALVLGSAFAVAGYMLVYRHNCQGIQVWYVCNLVVPVGLLLAALLPRHPGAVAGAALVFLVYLAPQWLTVPWPHQAGMMRAGQAIATREPGETFGSWNGGIISYFSKRRVVNLDGLTNDDILPYIKSNRLVEYMLASGIRRLVDYRNTFEADWLRQRGGYRDARFDQCFRPIERLTTGEANVDDNEMVIYGARESCR